MSISQGIKSFVGLITGGFEKENEDIFDTMQDDLEYPTQDNLALEPLYGSRTRDREERESKVVSHPSFRGYEVIVCEPRSYDQSVNIVKHLKERKTVILNLHLLDKDQSLRIVDFLCGATHALNGNQQRIGESVFIFTPQNINLSAESQKSKMLIKDALWNQAQQ